MRAILLLAATSGLFSQSAAPDRFEVASIKPGNSVSRSGGYRFAPGGRFTTENLPLRYIIISAWQVKEFQLSGEPAWVDSTTYDIAARAEGDPSANQIWLMVQNLLADRFKLKLRHETKEHPLYILTAAKTGPKLTESAANCEALAERPQPGGRGQCGNWFADANGITGTKITMPDLAAALSEELDRPVIDKTGFAGAIDVKLKWTPDGLSSGDQQTGPSIFTAVQEQLGLRLESQKGPVEMLIVEHVDRPTEN